MQPSANLINQLLSQARGGSTVAVEELLSTYRDYLRRLASQRLGGKLGGRVSPSDLVQEALLAAWKDFESFRGADATQFSMWMRKILLRKISAAVAVHMKASKRNVARECAQSPHTGSSILGGVVGLVAREQTPSKIVSVGEDAVLIQNYLAQLPEDYRLVIQWRNFEGVQFNDIAQRLGRTSGATRLLWLRAIRMLREIHEAPPQ